MAKPLRLLLIEDSETDFLLNVRNLKKHGVVAECCRVATFPEVSKALEDPSWDAVLSDFNLPQLSFRPMLARIRERRPLLPVILVSGSIGEEDAVDLMKEGVWDFVLKDRPARLARSLERSLQEARSRQMQLKAEAELRQSEGRYHSLFENMLDGYAHCRMIYENNEPVDFIYLAVNPAFERLTALKDVIGRKISEVVPGIRESNPELFQTYGRVALTGTPERLETFVPALGIWFSLAVFRPAQGEFVSVFDNITQRKTTELALREAEMHYRLLAENSADVIWLADIKTHRFVYVSPSVERLRGYTPEEVIAQPLEAALSEADVQQVMEHLPLRLQAFAAGDASALIKRYELDQPRKDGTLVPTEVVTTLVLDEHGVVYQILGVSRDITDRKRAEEERRRLEQEVLHSQKLESLGSLAGGIAHDMNNVLAAILGLSSALQAKYAADTALAKSLGTIEHAAMRGRDLVKSLTNFARKELEQPCVMDINSLIRKEMDILRQTTRQKVELQVELEDGLPPIMGEPGTLGSALMNLCVNAVDAMPDGGTLRLGSRRHGDRQIEMCVTDSGHGMSPEVLARATEPFFTTKPVGKGTGLGLAMVYSATKAHGGTLEIQSKVGEGTSIHLRFPIVSEESIPTAAESKTTKQPGGALRVLLVDDDELIRASFPSLLEQLGNTVSVAEDGASALALLERDPAFDVVLLDHNMPGMTGLETLIKLKSLCPDLPVVMATGFKDTELEKGLVPWPGVPVLVKPFPLQVVVETLARIARQKQGQD